MGQRAAALLAGRPFEAAQENRADGAAPAPVRMKANASEVLKLVHLSGAGLLDVNGTYELATPFARAEVFVKSSVELGTIYIRRQAPDTPDRWVVTLSPTEREGRHLYKRDSAHVGVVHPPTLGWEVYPHCDGIERALSLGDAPRLGYFHGYVGACGDGQPYFRSSRQRRTEPYVFRSDTNCLQVCIVGASDLQGTDGVESELYCVCEIHGKPEGAFHTPPQRASANPFWNHTFEVGVFESSDALMFSVKSKGGLLGQAVLEHSSIYPEGFIGDVPLVVPNSDFKGSMLSLCITPSNQEVPGIRCEIDKGAGTVGLKLVPSARRVSLSIVAIAEGGQVDRWNAENPLQRVKVRDQIVEVNGTRGECFGLLAELAQARGLLRMVVMRKLPL
ncbi:unnamed protein product [Prorocentrum cordatum]|uniref:C2 domain-containing protein n=1 Tax=Prorocentrum cordatum TaxID=2364126 RepID=A0ABN9Q1X5_9DINO|nr:unnamed protein product [Polarella glacialis]